jgi:radical SAM superfamily enzyme YgiQ (UPF0313 family)
MKLLLISPGIDNEESRFVAEANKLRMITPMLALPYLAALTPPDIEVKIIDEQHGLISHFEDADLVGITGMTMQANRMYKIADIYRSRNIPVVLGGIHVTFLPEEASKHADSIVIGEGDEIWPVLMEDFKRGELKPVYRCIKLPSLENLPFPRLDLIDGPSYRMPHGSLNSIMATRGCPNNCSFCCVTKMFGRGFRTRPVQHVIDEIMRMNNDPILFADDNLIGNRNYAMELFNAVKPLNKVWGGQASMKIAHDEELLNLAVESGCKSLFIGFESIDEENIILINKKNVNTVEGYSEAIKKLHDRGVHVYGSFIIGLDNDDESIFEKMYNFIEKNEIEFPLVGVLTPLPGTELFKQFENEGRIIDYNWNKYNFCQVVYKPKKMSADKLKNGYDMLARAIRRSGMRKQLGSQQASRLEINAF